MSWLAKPDPPTFADARSVTAAAARLHVSEFEIFQIAYQQWFGREASEGFLLSAFQQYLTHTTIPMWVRHFTRNLPLQSIASAENPTFSTALSTHHRLRPKLIDILLGCGILIALAAIVATLVYLAVLAQQTRPIQCMLPPCY